MAEKNVTRKAGPAYRLVALDLDGTVLLKDRPISERVRGAVIATRQRRVHVALVSGRMFLSALPFVQELGLTTPVICAGGAQIRQPHTGEVLYSQGIPLALAQEVIRVGREMGLPVNIYLDDQIYADVVSMGAPIYSLLSSAVTRIPVDLLSFLDRDPTHMALICQPEVTKQRVLDLRQRFGAALHVTSGHPLLAEINHPQVSKGRSLGMLADRLGVRQDEVLAMGNDWNDVDMLTYAGLGVAMGGSPPEVLAVADLVAPPAAEDGVAVVLEEYVLAPLAAREEGQTPAGRV